MRSWSCCPFRTIAHRQTVKVGVKPVGRRRHAHVYSQASAHSSYTASQDWKSENPGFDDIELDEDYYRSLGISEEELADQFAFLASDADPMGEDLGPEGLEDQQLGASSYLMDEDMNDSTWGPQAILLAGFKAEECAIIRCILDSAGSDLVKVIPCTSDMLYQSVEIGLNEPEVDWSQPRPEGWGRGREWGSQRVILFSGLSGAAVLTVVELLEEAGLPPLCIAMAEETDADRVVGEVLAEAIKAQRGRKTPQKHVWEVPGHASRRLPDLEELIGAQARERVQAFQAQPQQQQESQQQQLDEELVASSTSRQSAPVGSLQPDSATASTSQPTGTPGSLPAATALPPQSQHALPAAHSAAEPLTDVGRSMDVTEAGDVSVEEVRASQLSQTMAPGIDALRKRKAAALQQQSSAEDGMSLSQQQAQQASQDAEPEHALEEEAVAEATVVDVEMQTAAQATDRLDHTGPPQDQELSASSSPLNLPPDTDSVHATWTDVTADHHAGDSSNVSSPGEEHQRAVTSADQTDYDNLLDAIASGSLDWEPAGLQSSSTQAPQQEPNAHQHRQTQLQSQQPALDPTHLQQQTWSTQAEAMPSTPADRSDPHSAAAAPAAAAVPDQQLAMPHYSSATATPTHQQTVTEASQEPEAQSSQDFAKSEQSQQRPAEAGQRSWPWDDGRVAGSAPILSADVLARSGSGLRLRTASSASLRQQKQSSRKAARRSQNASSPLNPRAPARQGDVQEDEWRVVTSEQTTAEEFVKPPADIDNERPVWAASAVAPAAPAGAGAEAAQQEAGSKQSAPSTESRPLTKQELRALAARQGLDYERLLADALSRGIPVSD